MKDCSWPIKNHDPGTWESRMKGKAGEEEEEVFLMEIDIQNCEYPSSKGTDLNLRRAALLIILLKHTTNTAVVKHCCAVSVSV